jgi:prophage DNA circulation protein
MSLFSIIGLYEEMLLEGSYRGIGFSHVSGDDEPSRRVLAFLFPGQDITVFQDLGQLDGDIVVAGIVSGDDYVHQVDRLRAALQTPGPATLVSPWHGTLQVVLSPGKTPKFVFKAEQLRIATFTATFRRYTPKLKTPPDTLQGLLDSLADMRTAAYAMLASLLAPIALTLSAVSQVESLVGEVATVLGSLVSSCVNPSVGIAGSLPIGLLSSIGSAPFDATYAGTVGNLLSGPSAAIGGTTTPSMPSAMAPGGSTATPVPVDGRITAAMLLSASSQIGTATLSAAPIQIPPGPALILSAQMFLLADAASAASAIGFDSQQEAMTWRDQVGGAYDAAVLAAAALVPSSPTPAAALWRALIAAKSAWIADMNAAVGRLPPVEMFTPPVAASAWLYAQYLAGDDPSAIVATWRDLVQRNGICHPAVPPPGPLEVLA